jgi:hypothetical protein
MIVQTGFKDTDPDTGQVCQTVITGIFVDLRAAMSELEKSKENAEPNREYFLTDPLACYHCRMVLHGWYKETPRLCCAECLPRELDILESYIAAMEIFSDGTVGSLGFSYLVQEADLIRTQIAGNSGAHLHRPRAAN